MNKFFLIFFLILLNIPNFGQAMDGYGVKIGWGFANHSWEYNSSSNIKLDWESNSGFTARAFADISFLSFLNMEGEIGYAQKGAKHKIVITTISQPDGTGEYGIIDNRLDYLSISLMGKVKYNLELIIPYIILGPEYNYLLSKKIDQGFEVVYDAFKKNIFGFSAGFGSEIILPPINIIVEYRYSEDLTNNYNSSTIDIKNYSHTFLIGVEL
ncbi:MAG: PorT family protein [Melioribacteraceae bacterium]|nr:PorT family protein [Saprospiraceae bacterium]MCF8355914.1 PorT family protein [Melioribacteraceae bacterium]MCF8395454.1 PorT family protein [Melioribacteraceae bacterium]